MTDVLSRPEPGLWAVRVVANGPEVAARIFWTACPTCGAALDPTTLANVIERSPSLGAEIDGRPADPFDLWTRRRRPIGEGEYRFLIDDRAWARQYAPRDPAARPWEPITDERRRQMPAIWPT